MHRRRFLARLGTAAAAFPLALGSSQHREYEADVAVIGGGVGGCAAALAAARQGLRVVMTEETAWVGGQLTQQGVPPDEHPWIEAFGAPRSYRDFRRHVRAYYRQHYPLAAGAGDRLNPGGCWVSALCHEPRAALAVLEAMLAPHRSRGALTLLPHHTPVAAETDGDRVRAVRMRDGRTDDEVALVAPLFIDATEWGDLLPLTGTEYVTGSEAQAATGELHAGAEARPLNMQAVTWCFAMDYRPGEDHTIEPPADYAFWRDHVPDTSPPWPGRLLSLTYPNPVTLEPRTLPFDPRPDAAPGLNWWTYRRILDPAQFGGDVPGISLVNWPQNDYWLGPLIEVSDEERRRHHAGARAVSRSLLYWLQTEAPRPDGGAGWPGLRPRGDLMGTADGLALRPYVREGRRLRALTTVTEAHVGLEQRTQITGLPEGEVTATAFPDSVGVGSYRIDLHPSTGGDHYLDIATLPFEIPLGALLPQRVENLVAGGKALGTTHITNGCYRLHPVEWGVGEAAGLLAAYCAHTGAHPHQVHAGADHLADFQRLLTQQGVEIRWPDPRRMSR